MVGMSNYGVEEKEEEDNHSDNSSDDEEFEVELQRRFAELEKQGLVYNFKQEDEEEEEEDEDELEDAQLNGTHTTIQLVDSSQFLDEIRRNMSATTDILLSNLNKLKQEVKSIPSPPVSARRCRSVSVSVLTPLDSIMDSELTSESRELELLSGDDQAIALGQDINRQTIAQQNRAVEEQERIAKQIEMQNNRAKRRAQHEQYLQRKKEEMRTKQQQYEMEMARLEQLRIEQEKQEKIRREEEERILLEEQRRLQEAKKAKLEAEKKRIIEERKRKEDIERKRISEVQEQQRKEQERQLFEELERKRIEQENFRLLEENRRREEMERDRRERLEQKLREEKELLEMKKENFLEQSLASILTQQTYYWKSERLVYISKALIEFSPIIDAISDVSPLRVQLTDWQKSFSKQDWMITIPPPHKTDANDARIISTEAHFDGCCSNLLNEQLIQFNFGYDLQDDMENIISMVFSVEKLDGIDPFVLQKCRSLRSLSLDQNNIISVKGCLKSTSIENLSLNQNKLSSLNGIEDLKRNIKEISAHSNQIYSIDCLQECLNLTSVDLSMNVIRSLEPIRALHNLGTLNMYRNCISELPNLNRLTFLMSINLGRNNLEYVDPLAFASCKLLDELILYENKLTEIPELQNVLLRSLSLNGNQIRKIPDQFLFSPVLSILNLNSNQISSLKPFTSCVMLQILDLSFNNISYLSDLLCLEPCKRLMIIRLNDNPVSTKIGYREALISLLPKLETIDSDRVDVKEKTIVRNYTLTRSAKILSNYSSRIYRKLVLGRADLPDFDFQDDYEFICVKQVTEKKKFESFAKNQLFVSPNQMENQRRMAITLDLKTALTQQRREMRTRHFEEHLHFNIEQARNVFLPNEEYQRDKAVRVLQRLCKRCLRKRLERSRLAAIKIQKLWRGYWIRRKNHPWMLPLLKLRHQKATIIQAFWRGYYVRRLIREARRLEDELQFELSDFTDNFDDDVRFLDQANNIDMVGSVPRKVSPGYSFDIMDAHRPPVDSIKLPDIAVRNNWDPLDSRAITEQEEIIHQEIDEQLEIMNTSSNSQKQDVNKKMRRGRKDIELLAQEWGLSGNSAALAALVKSKKRKPQNHKKHKNMSAMERFSQFKHVALKEPRMRSHDDEKLELESVSSSSSSSGSSGIHSRQNGIPGAAFNDSVKLPSIVRDTKKQ